MLLFSYLSCLHRSRSCLALKAKAMSHSEPIRFRPTVDRFQVYVLNPDAFCAHTTIAFHQIPSDQLAPKKRAWGWCQRRTGFFLCVSTIRMEEILKRTLNHIVDIVWNCFDLSKRFKLSMVDTQLHQSIKQQSQLLLLLILHLFQSHFLFWNSFASRDKP